MEVLYHGIKTRYAYDFPLCFPHELIMSLRSVGNSHSVLILIGRMQTANLDSIEFQKLIKLHFRWSFQILITLSRRTICKGKNKKILSEKNPNLKEKRTPNLNTSQLNMGFTFWRDGASGVIVVVVVVVVVV